MNYNNSNYEMQIDDEIFKDDLKELINNIIPLASDHQIKKILKNISLEDYYECDVSDLEEEISDLEEEISDLEYKNKILGKEERKYNILDIIEKKPIIDKILNMSLEELDNLKKYIK